jgi:hypothetical protein
VVDLILESLQLFKRAGRVIGSEAGFYLLQNSSPGLFRIPEPTGVMLHIAFYVFNIAEPGDGDEQQVLI